MGSMCCARQAAPVTSDPVLTSVWLTFEAPLLVDVEKGLVTADKFNYEIVCEMCDTPF